jgi:hypothetical protein
MKAFALDPSKHKWLYKDDEEVFFADIYPQRPGQAEDDLNEITARDGYVFASELKVIKRLIKNETPSAFDVIRGTLGDSLGKLAYMGKSIITEQFSVQLSRF